MKIIRNIVASDTQPKNKNDIWLDTKTNTLNWGGEVIKAAPYKQTVEVTQQEIIDYLQQNPGSTPDNLISDKLNEAGITCEIGDTVDIAALTAFCADTNFSDKTKAVKLIGVAETADDFYFSKDGSAAWNLTFPALGITLSRDINDSKTIKIMDSEKETIESYTYKDLNSLNAFLSKYGLDKWNIADMGFAGFSVNNKGVEITVKDKMPVMYYGEGVWKIVQ